MKGFPKAAAAALGIAVWCQIVVACADIGAGPSSAATASGRTMIEASPGGGAQSSIAASEAPVARASMPSPVDMPFARYVQIVRQAADLENSRKRAATKPAWDRQQESIAKCMRRAGFEYFPVPMPEIRVDEIPGENLEIPWLSESRTDVERYGYGVPPALPEALDITDADQKNLDYMDTLNSAALREYNFALSGRDGYDVSSEISCSERAESVDPIDTAYDADNSWFESPGIHMTYVFLVSIDAEADPPAVGSIQADKAAMALREEWAKCVTKAGVAPDIQLRDLASLGPMVYFSRATRGTAEDIANSRAPDAGFARDLALADFDCRVATDFVIRYADIQANLEQQVLDQHAPEFETLVATWEQQRK